MIAEGTPEHVASVEASATGRFLRDVVDPGAPPTNGAAPSGNGAKRTSRRRRAKRAAKA